MQIPNYKSNEIDDFLFSLQLPSQNLSHMKPHSDIFGFIQHNIEIAVESLENKDKIRLCNAIINVSNALAYKLESNSAQTFDILKLLEILKEMIETGDSDLISSAIYCASNIIFFKKSISHEIYFIFEFLDSLFEDDIDSNVYRQTLPLLINSIILMPEDREKLINFIDHDQILSLTDVDPSSAAICTKLMTVALAFDPNPHKLDILKIITKIYRKSQHLEMNNEFYPEVVNFLSVMLIKDKELYQEIIDTDIISELIVFMMPQYSDLVNSLFIFLCKVSSLVFPQIAKIIYEEIDLNQLCLISESTNRSLVNFSYLILSFYITYFPTSETLSEVFNSVKNALDYVIQCPLDEKRSCFSLIFSFIDKSDEKHLKKLVKLENLSACMADAIDNGNVDVYAPIQSIFLFCKRMQIDFDFTPIIEALDENMDNIPEAKQNEAQVILSLFTEPQEE